LLRKLRLGKPAELHLSEASEGCRGVARRAKPGSIRSHCLPSYGSASQPSSILAKQAKAAAA